MTDDPTPGSLGKTSLQKVGGFTAVCVLVSNVIGSGIFTTTGFMARDLGDAGMILGLWVGGALFALVGAMCYGELGAALPRVGGEYIYLRRAYGPFLGFLSGWVSFTVGFSAAIAAAALSFASYFLQLIPLGEQGGAVGKGLALGLVWLVTAVHMAGVGPGGLLQRTLTVLKIAAIFLLVTGALSMGQGNWEHLTIRNPAVSPGTGTLVVSFIFVIYAYSGWNVAGYLAGEITNPGRTIPRTMIGGTIFVGLVYLALNLTYLYALPVTALGQAPLLPVAEKAARALFGPSAAQLVAGVLCLSISGAVSAMVWAGPRVYYAMARDGLLPALFGRTHGVGGAPRTSILMQSLWASLLVLTGTFERLLVYSGFVLTIFSALAVAAVMVLRLKAPDLHRPFRIPLYPLPPLAYLAVAALIVTFALVERPVESVLAIGTVLAGVPFYLLAMKSSRREAQADG